MLLRQFKNITGKCSTVIWKKSPICITVFLQYVFDLTAWKMAIRTAHQRLIFQVEKPLDVPILT
jgi:hypothetical protein